MTPEQRREAICKACGWSYDNNLKQVAVSIDGNSWPCPESHRCWLFPWPSLDAMHEAETLLKGEAETWDAYCENLEAVYGRGHHFRWNNLIGATFGQREEAFLKTLGLWTE